MTSDWHLDAVTAGVERFADIRLAVTASIALAVDQGAALYVFAGDLSDPDTPRCWRAATAAISAAQELAEHGIPSLWVQGNHDVVDDQHGSSVLMPLWGLGISSELVEVALQPTVKEIGGVVVAAFPYVSRARGYDPIEWVRAMRALHPRVDLVVGHLLLEGIAPGSESDEFARGRDIFLPIDEIREAWPDAVVINGHYHRREVYRGVQIPGAIAKLTRGEVENEPVALVIALEGK